MLWNIFCDLFFILSPLHFQALHISSFVVLKIISFIECWLTGSQKKGKSCYIGNYWTSHFQWHILDDDWQNCTTPPVWMMLRKREESVWNNPNKSWFSLDPPKHYFHFSINFVIGQNMKTLEIFLFSTEKKWSYGEKKNIVGGWTGFGMLRVWIDPNDDGSLHSNPTKW